MYRYLAIFMIFLVVCSKNPSSPDDTLNVKVLNPSMNPIAGANISGGVDWTYYRETTDENGIAHLPDHALGSFAYIYKNNYYTQSIDKLYPITYILEPTTKQLMEIGSVEGEAVKFDATNIITIKYEGIYLAYLYNDNQVLLQNEVELPHICRSFRLYGDTLWIGTFENGIYVYSIENHASPTLLFELPVDGIISKFARKDSILATNSFTENFLKIYAVTPDHELTYICDIECDYLNDLKFYDDYLVTVGRGEELAHIFDFSDLNNIENIYSFERMGWRDAIIYGNKLVMVPVSINPDWTTYPLIDISDPTNPDFHESISANGLIYKIIDDSMAIGIIYPHSQSYAVFKKSYNHYHITAVNSERGFLEDQGANPPYFIIGNRLLKLVD